MTLSGQLRGQDPYFSSSDILLFENPAQTSSTNEFERKGGILLKYRDQWRSLSDPSFTTFLLQANFLPYASALDNWNLGMTVYSDRSNAGVLSNSTFQGHAAYSRNFGYSYQGYHSLSLGATIGYYRTNITDNNLWFGRQYDMSNLQIDRSISTGENFDLQNSDFVSVSLGSSWEYRKKNNLLISSSLAFHHLNQPDYGFINSQETISPRINFNFLVSTKLTNKIAQGGFLKFVNQNPSRQGLLGYFLSFNFKDYDETIFRSSIATRLANGIDGAVLESFIIGIALEKSKWTGSLHYDMNTSSLNYFTRGNGALELTMAYYFVTD